ncbi:WhiB family transcriptional regulator [Streptosporangium sp. NPDC051023]|uniref:WhiB family transcriptional regulator n=1 Tax=Streptosporangium sp. NPDC051023 TaxID=3155410 RepID=UPI00344F7535
MTITLDTAHSSQTFPADGSCADQPDLMTPDVRNTRAVETAVETCLSCPAYLQCLAWITNMPRTQDPGGIIAALTEAERIEQFGPTQGPEVASELGARLCTRCNELRSPEQFYASSPRWCIPCRQTYSRARYQPKPKLQTMRDVSSDGTPKHCSDCHQHKPITDFARNKSHRDGRDNLCKSCQKIRRQDRARRAQAPQAVAR